LLYRRLDFQEDAVNIFHHVVVPESDDAIPSAFDKCRSSFVSGVVRMLPAIELDDEPEFVACEIAKEWSDRRLSAEVMLFERRLT
jgi:hypothetical protein